MAWKIGEGAQATVKRTEAAAGGGRMTFFMLLLKMILQILLVTVPHVIALPAVVVFLCGWGVNHAAFPRFMIAWIMAVPLTILSPLVLGNEPATGVLYGEIIRSWKLVWVFAAVSWGMYLTGRIQRAKGPPSGLSNDVGRVRFLPRGTFWQMVPTVVLTGLAVADYFVWKAFRPLSTLGAFYGLMMAWDYLKAIGNDRAMRVGVN